LTTVNAGRERVEAFWRALAQSRTACACRKEHPMMDAIMLAIGLVFFALSVGYVVACDRL
jgi:hypothetical protein